MPTPWELLTDPISLIVFTLYAVLILWEWLAPARQLPVVSGWRWRGLAAFAVLFFVSSYLPLLWADHLSASQWFDLSSLGTIGGAVVGLVVYEAGVYAWHRSMHRHDALWRAFHQMHHSAERLDTFGAYYFSPLDMIGWTLLSSVCLTLLGISAEAVTVFLYTTTFLSIFQHANVRTPRWLGYVIQRPESHTVHHNKGVHAYNYSDLPIFDFVFGTFRNPKGYLGETGFYDGASTRIVDMLLMRDVSQPMTQGDLHSQLKRQAHHFHTASGE